MILLDESLGGIGRHACLKNRSFMVMGSSPIVSMSYLYNKRLDLTPFVKFFYPVFLRCLLHVLLYITSFCYSCQHFVSTR